MKKVILWSSAALIFLSAIVYGFTPAAITPIKPINDKMLNWYTLEEAIEANEKQEKKIFIDIYTDWCKWCHVMDQKTFSDPDVIRYLNENFYVVKFNAENQNAITFKGKEYKFLSNGKRGIHGLAYDLLDRSASYPSFVTLDASLNRLGIIKGFKTPSQFLNILKEQTTL